MPRYTLPHIAQLQKVVIVCLPMRTREHTDFLQTIRPLTETYTPNDDVLRYTKQLTVAAIIGPTGVGKNTVMDLSNVPLVTAITSREPRPVDTIYRRFLNFDNPADRKETAHKLLTRSYVQASSHPATHELYATETVDFPRGISLMDMTAYEYERLRTSGIFGRLFGICLVADDFSSWQSRWRTRGIGELSEYRKRMVEGSSSLTYCLQSPDMAFVLNPNDDAQTAAETIRLLTEGQELDPAQQEAGRQAAELMLAGIRQTGFAA